MIRFCWWTNLDAEFELAKGPGYRPSPRMSELCRRLGARFVAAAREHAEAGIQHRQLSPDEQPDADEILLPWAPTPAARRRFPDHVPDLADGLLAELNHRHFAHRLGAGPAGSRYFSSSPELLRWWDIQDPKQTWVLKRGLSFSGRWQKRHRGPLDAAARRWIEASMGDYGRGLVVEPELEVLADFALHAWLDAEGRCLLGQATAALSDGEGRWQSSRPAGDDLAPDEHEALRAAGLRVGEALRGLGYRGPFGIDSYRFRNDAGTSFLALSEINVRFTMGFPCGFAARHRVLRRS